MSRSVWLDDERKRPLEFDVWVKTADAAIAELEAGGVTTISLDHDLAWEHYETACEAYRDDGSLDRSRFRERTGYDVVLWMAEHNVWPALPDDCGLPDVSVGCPAFHHGGSRGDGGAP